jgi:hypothetical protein
MLSMRKLWVLLAIFVLMPGYAVSAQGLAPVIVIKAQNRADFIRSLKINGFRVKGGISSQLTNPNNTNSMSFPHFSSSFSYKGTTYPYTMVGYPPSSGMTSSIRPVIIPLRMNFLYFDVEKSFDPAVAVDNILKSPLFNAAPFPNGVGQFGDMLQRATFWNKMDKGHGWHVLLSTPRVLPTINVLVEPDIGDLYQLGPGPDDFLGNIRFGAMDSTIHTLMQFIGVAPDELPIFVTGNVYADALGYHDAYVVGQGQGNAWGSLGGGPAILQTLIYSSWLDINLVGPLLADVSTLNHEIGEWLNDPYVNNIVPLWNFPNIALCGDNPYLEVGDPQGNGPNVASFPTVPIQLNGYTYHLQDLVMLPWFAGEAPSTAQNGWYDFPSTTQITSPFVPCSGGG